MSLEQRLTDFAQRIAQVINQQSGATITRVVVNVPFNQVGYAEVNVPDAQAIIGKSVICSLGQTTFADVNEAEDLEGMTISGSIYENGTIKFKFQMNSCFGGPIPVNYMVG